jgi:hypothetical protein
VNALTNILCAASMNATLSVENNDGYKIEKIVGTSPLSYVMLDCFMFIFLISFSMLRVSFLFVFLIVCILTFFESPCLSLDMQCLVMSYLCLFIDLFIYI